jgi:hypothetical protein
MNAAQDFSFGEFDEASSTLIMTNRPPAMPTIHAGSGVMQVATPYESAIMPVAKPKPAPSPSATMLPPPLLPTVADDSINPVSFDSDSDPNPTALRSTTKKYRRATIALSFALLTTLSLAGTLAYAMFSGTQTVPQVARVAHQGVTRTEQLSLDRPVSSPDANLKAAASAASAGHNKKAKKKRSSATAEPDTTAADLSGRDLLSDGLSE